MADSRSMSMSRDAGFTLAEMLVALSILTIGVTTLLAALGNSMSLRRTTDARLVAQQAAEDVALRVAQSGLRLRPGAESPFEIELVETKPVPLEGAPGMEIACKLEAEESRPDIALLRVQVSWLEGGDRKTEEFLRVLPRQLSLAARIRTFREEHVRPR